jgi:hypothetical protein
MSQKEMRPPTPRPSAAARPTRVPYGAAGTLAKKKLLGAGGDDHVGAAARPDRSKKWGRKKFYLFFGTPLALTLRQ